MLSKKILTIQDNLKISLTCYHIKQNKISSNLLKLLSRTTL